MNGTSLAQQNGTGGGMQILPKPLSSLSAPDQSLVKTLALRGYFTGLLVAAAIGGAAVITTLSAVAFVKMGDKPKRKRRR